MKTKKYPLSTYEYTPEQLDLVAHALGINLYGCQVNESAKGEKIYRNYYNTNLYSKEYHLFQKLVDLKLARKRNAWTGNSIFFHITSKGALAFINQFHLMFPDAKNCKMLDFIKTQS